MNVSAPPTLIICCRRQHLHADRLLPPLRGLPPSLREAAAIHEPIGSIYDDLSPMRAPLVQIIDQNKNLWKIDGFLRE